MRVPPACSPNPSSEKTWPHRQEPTGVWRMKLCACKNTHPWIRQWAKKQNAGNDTLCNSSYLQFRRVRANVEEQTPEQAVAGRVSRSKHFLGPWQCSGSPGSTGYNIYIIPIYTTFLHPILSIYFLSRERVLDASTTRKQRRSKKHRGLEWLFWRAAQPES